jgi:hypothetical protein
VWLESRGWRHQFLRCQTFELSACYSVCRYFLSARCAGLPVAIIVTRNGTFTRRLIVGTCLAELAARQSAGHPVCMPRWHAPCVAGYRCGLSGAEAGPKWPCLTSLSTERREVPHQHLAEDARMRPAHSISVPVRSAARAAGFAQTQSSRFSKRPPLHTKKTTD